jgi:integrase
VDWERGRITITSPKTEHHEGKESRVIPLFPELRPLLEQAFDEAPEGAEYFIRRYRNTNANLRTQLKRILKKAGVEAWPKLFQNLRASRETELAEEYPAHVVAAWMGHSMIVSAKHYLQVRDSDFDKALLKALQTGSVCLESGRGEALLENTENTFASPTPLDRVLRT